MQSKKGFTLIEVMVVIAIIGLLSSIVLAAVSTTRDRARIAAGTTLAGHAYQGLGATAIGAWNFDQYTVGSAIQDSGAMGTVLTPSGAIPLAPSTPGGGGKALDLSGNLNYYLTTGDISAKGYTLSSPTVNGYSLDIWVFPTSGGLNADLALAFGSTATPRLATIIFSGGGMYIGPEPNAGWNPVPNYNPPVNKWTNIAYSYNFSTGTYKVYIDGSLYDTRVQTTAVTASNAISQFVVGSTQAALGAGYSTRLGFPGYIDNVAFYTQNLTAADFQRIYAEGLPSHQFAVK